MRRPFGWILPVAFGMMLGLAINSIERTTGVSTTPTAQAQSIDDDLNEQVKEIKKQVKEINNFLQSGKLQVVVAINPDA